MTAGSPLESVLARFFPAAYPAPSYMSAMLRRQNPGFEWLNVSRPRDPVGSHLGLESDRELQRGGELRIHEAHTGYWRDPALLALISESVAEIVHHPPARPGGDEPMSPRGRDEDAFALPSYLGPVRKAARRAWAAVGLLGLVAWWLSGVIAREKTQLALGDQPTAYFDGYLMGRIQPARWYRAERVARPSFWVEYWPEPGEPSVCISVDATVDPACTRDLYFPSSLAATPPPEVRRCFDAPGREPLRQIQGRFVTESIEAVAGRAGPATVTACQAKDSVATRGTFARVAYPAVAWAAPFVILAILVRACVARRGG